jgi:hypothetical protein
MRPLPKGLLALGVAVVVIGCLALVGYSSRSAGATAAPDTAAPGADTAAQSWQALKAHVGSSLPGLETDIGAVESAGQAGDTSGTTSAAETVKSDAANEVAWLQTNPAALCYQAVYDDYLSANQTLETAMTDLINGEYTAANALIAQFNSSIGTLANDTATTAC